MRKNLEINGEQMNKIFSVFEINDYISRIINNNERLININVQGEISNLTKHNTGHYYFTLKDSESSLKSIIFKSNIKNIKINLKEGMKIIALGTVKGYSRGGTYSFWINSVKLDGVGDVYLQFEQLKKFYSQKGYFDKSIKLPIPKFPKNIGIVTAETGAAIKDIISTINRRYNNSNIYLFPCIVQGEDAPKDIKSKIEEANNFKNKLDVLIVGRGGGSFEDLSCFSHKEVIEAIYKSKVPIISAVGHEIDFQLSDFVADKRAETPTAAAEIVTPDKKELLKFIDENFITMYNGMLRKIRESSELLIMYKNNYHLKNLNWICKEKEIDLINEINKMNTNIKNKLKIKEINLNRTINELKLLTPINVLSRSLKFIDESAMIMRNTMQRKISKYSELLIMYKNNYHLKNLNWICKEKEIDLINEINKMNTNIKNKLKIKEINLNRTINELKLLNPTNILSRGYSITKNLTNNKILSSIKNVNINDKILIKVFDGNIYTIAKKINEKGKE